MKPAKTFISRGVALQLGSEAVQIIESGQFCAPSGRLVNIAELLNCHVAGAVGARHPFSLELGFQPEKVSSKPSEDGSYGILQY